MNASTSTTNVRVKTFEIGWHDTKPITSCDFQPRPFKRVRPPQTPSKDKDPPTPFIPPESYRLATGAEDHNVRIWMVYPHLQPSSAKGPDEPGKQDTTIQTPRPPRVEYRSTLSRHTASVNVVRWSPSGEILASAGDDGMILLWAQSATPSTAFGSEASEEESMDKEHWKARVSIPCTTMQIYDLAWSPTGEYIIAGSTDNTARIFSAADGKCIRELADHTHFVQGVAWDPMNEYLATQSSDRSVHVHNISAKQGSLEIHAVGKNTKLTIKHSHASSVGNPRSSRPRVHRRDSASDTESAITSASISEFREEVHQMMQAGGAYPSGSAVGPLTPSASIASTPSVMFPPPPVERATSSRRSSFSSQAPASPALSHTHSTRVARSPSPMPPLPAIRSSPGPGTLMTTKLYGDENFSTFFRRLSFSPDGALLLTPAGHFEDPSVSRPPNSGKVDDSTPPRGRNLSRMSDSDPISQSSVYIYSRANFLRPPIGQIPGFKKPSIAVRFSPILYTLRPSVVGEDNEAGDVKRLLVERGREENGNVNLTGPVSGKVSETLTSHKSLPSEPPTPSSTTEQHPPYQTPSTPTQNTSSVFALPYRMMFAIATTDTITIHDTQQAGPICLLTQLHYAQFTDMTWSPDGQCLLLASRDGFCTIVIFDEPIPAHSTQQHGLQLQSIAQLHGAHVSQPQSAVPLPFPSPSPTPGPVFSSSTSNPPPPSIKRPLTPAPSEPGSEPQSQPPSNGVPAKKKRRVELTKIGEIDS